MTAGAAMGNRTRGADGASYFTPKTMYHRCHLWGVIFGVFGAHTFTLDVLAGTLAFPLEHPSEGIGIGGNSPRLTNGDALGALLDGNHAVLTAIEITAM